MAIALASFLSLAPSSEGAITVHFVEEDGGVRISFDGSIELDWSIGGAADLDMYGALSATALSTEIQSGGPGFKSYGWGLALPSPLPTFEDNFFVGQPWESPLFGFGGGFLFYSAVHVSGGSVLRPTELTVKYDDSGFLLNRADIRTLNLSSSVEGSVLWAAGGAATSPDNVFKFSSIPEPSSVLSLGALLAFGLLFRTRR